MTREEALKIVRENYTHFGTTEPWLDLEKALATLIPELAESNDERIRKEIVGVIQKHYPNTPESYRRISWLEKQKEQKPVDDKAFEEWIDDWWKHNKVNNPDSYDKGDEIQFDEKGFKNFCRGIRNMYAEQKPAEWSDTNELVFKDICNHLKEEGYNGWIVLLNALRNGEFQPKQEWSDEDEKIVNNIVAVLGQYIDYKAVSGTGSGYATPRYAKEIDWLKSLRPSWKPSEEQMEALEYVIRDYREDSCNATANYLQEILDHLKNM